MRSNSSRGFTLIELVTTTALIGMLGSLSLLSLNIIRQKAYLSAIDNLIHQGRNAIEAGKVNLAEADPTWYGAWRNTPGQMQDWAGRDFVPGLINPANYQQWIWHNGWCDQPDSGDWCIKDGGSILSCKGKIWKSWWVQSDGTYNEFWMEAFWGC